MILNSLIILVSSCLVGAKGIGDLNKKLYEVLKDDDGSYYGDNILGSSVFYENTYVKQPYAANGYIGTRIPNVGFGYSLDTYNIWTNSDTPGALDNGWPLRNRRFSGAFVSDFYCLEEKLNSTNFPELDDNGYTTVIASIPQWSNLQISVDNDTKWFNATEITTNDITNYSQNLSLTDGIVTTQMDWLEGLVTIKSEIFCHKKILPLAIVSLNLTLNTEHLEPGEELHLKVHDILDFNTSHRTVFKNSGFDAAESGIFITVEPDNVPYSNAAIYSTCLVENGNQNFVPEPEFSTEERISQVCDLILCKETTNFIVRKYVGIVSTEYHSNDDIDVANLDFAKQIAVESKGDYDFLLTLHKKAWEKTYNGANIEIPSDSFLEMTAKASLFHLFSNTRDANVSRSRGLPIAVPGLSSDSYGGMVFWDADIWIQPALLPFSPDTALAISNYRNSTHQQAVQNAESYSYPGAVYPWTSGRFANCTSTGPCIDYEYHINIDIALATFSIYLNGADGGDEDYLRYTTWPIIRDAADFFASYVTYNATLDKYETHNLTDPDEFANHIDNGAFTNTGIKTLLKWATEIGCHLNEEVDTRWIDISQKIYIPKAESNITMEYSGMNSSIESKQADVLLLVYPLGYIDDDAPLHPIKDLYYYAEHQSSSGPAMTSPVYAVAVASLLDYGSSSQSYMYESVLPFLRSPFAQFSEQADDNYLTNGNTQPAFPFLTANGGFLQVLLFGFTGIRYSYDVDPETEKISRKLKFNPIPLPLLPGGIAIRNFKYMDQTLDIIIDDENGVIIHKDGNRPINIEIPEQKLLEEIGYKSSSFNIVEGRDPQIRLCTLSPGESVVVPLPKLNFNIEGNIIESKEVTNLTAGVPGDVAYSILDGNNFTHWQPLQKNETALLLIDLGDNNTQKIKRGLIIWGERPAKNISMLIAPDIYDFDKLLGHTTERQGFNKSNKLKECIVAANGDCSLNLTFIPIIQNLDISPSEKFMNSKEIDILPSNKTEFSIENSDVQSSSFTRFIVLGVEGAYGDDTDESGATIKEFVLFAE